MPRAEGFPAIGDGKAPDAFRTIGEVEAALGIKAHVLRYWEEQIAELKPLKRAGGRRLYRPEDIALLRRIDDLVHRQGFTLKGVRLALRQGGRETPVPGAVVSSTERPPETGDRAAGAYVLERLKAIRAELRTVLETLPG